MSGQHGDLYAGCSDPEINVNELTVRPLRRMKFFNESFSAFVMFTVHIIMGGMLLLDCLVSPRENGEHRTNL